MKKIISTVIFMVGIMALLSLPFFLYYQTDTRNGSDRDWMSYVHKKDLLPLQAESVAIKDKPKNIIIFIADGLGFAHLSLNMALHEGDSQQIWHQFTSFGWHRPHAFNGYLIDSAASASALATGLPAWNGTVGIHPLTGKPVKNLFELAESSGYRTGIVTDSYIWDATPAAFLAHSINRSDGLDIMNQIVNSNLDVLFGELEDVGEDGLPDKADTLKLLEKRFTLIDEKLDATEVVNDVPIGAVFDEESITHIQSSPNLKAMTEAALARLSSSNKPFVLMVESEEPDTASHRNDNIRLINGMRSIESALASVVSFAQSNPNTLVLFTSDHETGGLALISNDKNSKIHSVWPTDGHSGTVVPVMALGTGSQLFNGIYDTEEIGKLLLSLIVNK